MLREERDHNHNGQAPYQVNNLEQRVVPAEVPVQEVQSLRYTRLKQSVSSGEDDGSKVYRNADDVPHQNQEPDGKHSPPAPVKTLHPVVRARHKQHDNVRAQ